MGIVFVGNWKDLSNLRQILDFKISGVEWLWIMTNAEVGDWNNQVGFAECQCSKVMVMGKCLE